MPILCRQQLTIPNPFTSKVGSVADDSFIVFSRHLCHVCQCNDPKTIFDLDRSEVVSNTGAAPYDADPGLER